MCKVEKIIYRDKLYKPSQIAMNLGLLKEKKQFQLIDEFIDYYGIMRIMKDIYDEDINQNNLENSLLYNSYLEVCSSQKDNSLFKVAYKIKKDMALRITEHIEICRISNDSFFEDKRVVPWYTIESNIYVADSWWETDEDIIKDFRELSYMDFLIKYKMY